MRVGYGLIAFTALSLARPNGAEAAVGDWKSYSRLILRRIAATSTEVWAATEGGIIRSDLTTGSVRTYSPTDGLPDKSILSLLIDGNTTWFGTDEGGLLRFTSIPGISQPRLELPPLLTGQITTIRTLAVGGANLYMGHSTGVTVMDRATEHVVETYHQLAPAPEMRNVQITAVAVVGNRLLAGFDQGLSYASLDDNLLLPSSWTYLRRIGFDPQHLTVPVAKSSTAFRAGATTGIVSFDTVAAILTFEGNIYVATYYGVQQERGSGWRNVLSGAPTRDLAVFDDAIWAATDSGLFVSTDGETWTRQAAVSGSVRALAAVTGEMIIVASEEGTFRVDGIGDTSPTKVAGVDIPPSDLFLHLAIDTSGAVWVAPGGTRLMKVEQDVNRMGVFALKNDRWRHFPSGSNGMLWPPGGEPGSGYISIAVDTKNRVWTGTWGTGICVIDQSSDPPVISSLTNYNSSLTGLRNAPYYTVVYGLLPDPGGAMWAILWDSFAFAISSGLGGYSLQHIAGPFIASGELGPQLPTTALALDHFGVLWVGTLADGIVLFDTGDTPLDGSDDQLAGTIGLKDAAPGPGLPSWLVSAIAVDQEGVVWVGTDQGLAKFSGTYDRAMNTYRLDVKHITTDNGLPSNRVQAIVVDSANTKWIGTDKGLAQVLASGQVVNLSSARLVDPAGNVAALAFDAARGYLWVGTPRGLNRYEAYPPQGESEQITAQPSANPFYIGLSVRGEDYVLTGKPLTIVVSPGATVCIYTITGELVWEQTDGGIGQVTWDGRTPGGSSVVASGVYLYLAERGAQKKVGKIAVLRNAR